MLPTLMVPPLMLFIKIVEVPAFNVSPVETDAAKLLEVVHVTVLLPRLIVRVLELLDDRLVVVTLKLLVVKTPLVIVIVVDTVSAS